MTKTSRKFVHHYAGVAIFVGLLSSFGTWTAMRFVTASSAQPAPAAAKPLLVQPLADLPGREVRITLLDRAPGAAALRTGILAITRSATWSRAPTSSPSTASPA